MRITTIKRIVLLCMMIGSIQLRAQDMLLTSAMQSPLKTKVPIKRDQKLSGVFTLQKDSITLREILKSLEVQTNYVFIYTDDEIPVNRILSVKVKDQPMDVFLSKLFDSLKIKYRVFGNQIALSVDKRTSQHNSQQGAVTEPVIAIEQFSALSVTQDGEPNRLEIVSFMVTGVIKDESGGSLPGVNILEKGTSNGTVSDRDGNFSLDVANANSILIFSYIGYKSQEVPVNGNASIQISMEADVETLGEIVVVGYGSQKRSDLTGAVASVKASEVRNMPVRSINEALQGRVAGVTVTKGNGAPGAGSDIVIRGAGSINGMAPLYIVDGVRMGTGYNFNIQDIESIEILKDASSAAIYGSQAAGGVILVTTKRGAQDKMQINFNMYAGVRQPVQMYSLLDRDEFVLAKSEFGTDVSSWGNISELPDTDWVDELFKNGTEQSYSLSLSGGSEKSNYYASASYQDENGIRIDNSFKRYSLRFNSDYKIGKKVKVGETLFAWKGSFNPTQESLIPFRSVPTQNVYDPTNPLGGWGKTPSYFAGGNPVGNELRHHRVDETYALEGNLYIDVELLKGLSVRGLVGTSFIGHNDSDFGEAYDFGSASNNQAQFIKNFSKQENYSANVVATYKKSFGDHSFKVLGGYEMYREDGTNLRGTASGFSVPVAESFNLNNNISSQRVEGGVTEGRRLLSQFGRIEYEFMDRYLLNASIRRDGNDRFAPDNRWGIFPSVSGAWKISQENFMAEVNWLSSLKLRAGYGVLGNDGAIAQFAYQGSYGSQNITGLPDGSRVVGTGLNLRLPNDQIKWEEVSTFDIGLDAGLVSDRLQVTLDYYDRQTKDMIYQLRAPVSAGLGGFVPVNIGQMSNRGIEFSIDYRGGESDFKYQIGFNSAFNTNKVIKLDGDENVPIDDGNAGEYIQGPISRTAVGNPIGQFYGYHVEGIFATDQQVGERGVVQTGAGAGDLIFKDMNGDNVIDELDRTYIGNPWPKMTYGITASFSYKGFDLSLLFQGVQGVDVYNGSKYFTQFLAGDYNTTSDVFNGSFFNGNGLTDQPRLGYTNTAGDYIRDPNGNYTKISSYYVEDGSFLKLRNVQFGYNLAPSTANRLGISSARIFFMAQNIFTITGYSGMDPEVVGTGSRAGTTARGIDTIYEYPRTSLLSLGLDLAF